MGYKGTLREAASREQIVALVRKLAAKYWRVLGGE